VGSYPPMQSDVIGAMVGVQSIALAIYWMWIYPMRNALGAAEAAGRSRYWAWLGLHPMFGWPVYIWLKRKTSYEAVGFLNLPRWGRILCAGLLVFYGGTVTLGVVMTQPRWAPLQLITFVVWAVASWLVVIRAFVSHAVLQWVVTRAAVLMWLAVPALLIATGAMLAPDATWRGAQLGAVIGAVLVILVAFTGHRQVQTVWYDRQGRETGRSDWKTIGWFLPLNAFVVLIVVVPIAGAIGMASVQGGRVLRLW
jgi:hypothetical protein